MCVRLLTYAAFQVLSVQVENFESGKCFPKIPRTNPSLVYLTRPFLADIMMVTVELGYGSFEMKQRGYKPSRNKVPAGVPYSNVSADAGEALNMGRQ